MHSSNQIKDFKRKEEPEGGYPKKENHEILGSTPWDRINKNKNKQTNRTDLKA